MNDMLVQTALRNLPQYLNKSGLSGTDLYSAMLCFETLRNGLTEQPRSSVPGEAVAWRVTADACALAAANSIADQFAPGFFDDGMVEGCARIITAHMPVRAIDDNNLLRALTEYPEKNPQQLQARKVCEGVLALAKSYESNIL
jgi:hypothetical protein